MTLRRAIVIVGLAAFAVAGVGVTIGYLRLRPQHLTDRLARAVESRMHLDTRIGDLAITRFSPLTLEGHNLELRIPGRPDLPAFVAVDHFVMDASLVALWHERVGTIRVDGLRITIPPSGTSSTSMKDSMRRLAHPGRVVIEHLLAHDAMLTILRRAPGHEPLEFAIHELALDQLGFDGPIPYRATLTNPVPQGEVRAQGTVGPWATAPADLPLTGTYEFTEANLDTIRGIGGMLASTGEFDGTLAQLTVKGESRTPDFNLDMGGRPVPLTTTFTAIVDSSNGTTHLSAVDAVLFHTKMHVTGDLINRPGPIGFDINLRVSVTKGRIEDVLSLAMDRKSPALTGDISMSTAVRIPAGRAPVRDRMALSGTFNLDRAVFNDGDVQRKLVELSDRSRAKNKAAPAPSADPPVMTHITGPFTLEAHQLSLPDLSFQVPGADVSLAGSYWLPTGAIDFEGDLNMQATVSQSMGGGFKSLLARPLDPLFKRPGVGAVLPIRISGTRQAPKVGLRLGIPWPGRD